MKIIPLLELYQDRATGNFTILNFCEDNELHVAIPCGRMIEHTLAEFKLHGLGLTMQHLKEYSSRKRIGMSEFEDLTEAAQIAFRKSKKLVDITLQKGTELWIDPMHWLSDGKHMTGLGPSERRVVKVTDTQSEFFRAVSEALELAD